MKTLPLIATNSDEEIANHVLTYAPEKRLDDEQINHTIDSLAVLFGPAYANIGYAERQRVIKLVNDHQEVCI